METKQVEITCPCCDTRLLIDVRTGKILRKQRAGEVGEDGKPVVREEDWEEASGRVVGRLDAAAEKLDAGLSREKSREKDLDDLFRKASEKLKRGEGEEGEAG